MKKQLAYVLYDFHTGGMETSIFNVASRLKEDFELHFIATHVKEIHKKFKKIGKTAFIENKEDLADYYINNKIDIVQVNIEDWYAKMARQAGVKRIIERTDGDRNCCKSSKRYVDHVIASTKGTVPLIAKQIERKNITVVYNGVNQKTLDRNMNIADRGTFGKGDIVVGRIGRLVGGKNISMLIRVMIRLNKEISKAKLMIVGGDSKMPGAPPMMEQLKQEARPLGGSVCFTGDVVRPEGLINGFDIGVCVSNPKNEGIPNSLLEPMGAGVPAIGTDVGNINELVKSGLNGFLIPHSKDDFLYTALKRLILNDKLRKQMGINARKTITENFSMDNMIKQYKRIYLG